MAIVSMNFYSVTKDKLSEVPVIDGNLIFVRDKRKIFLDSKGERVEYSSIITLATNEERINLSSPLEGLYFVENPSALYSYSSSSGWEELSGGGTVIQDGSLTFEKFSNNLKLITKNEYVTPEMYGAVGNGTTNDTSAIQSALDYAYTNKVPVYFSKKYKVTATLNVHDWCYLIGNSNKASGISTILYSPGGGTVDAPSELFVNSDSTKTLYRHSFENLYIKKENGFAACFGETCPIDNGSFVRDCYITDFNIVFNGFIGHVSRVENNTFNSVMFAFDTKNITDSYICNNYISAYKPFAPFCFYGGMIRHSEVSGNFFDYWFGIFNNCADSKISMNIFDFCYMVFGYADAFDNRYNQRGIEIYFPKCAITNNVFPNCANCVTGSTGFGEVMSDIQSSYLGAFKKEMLEGFTPTAVFVAQITKNADNKIIPKAYFYRMDSTFSCNAFESDGIIIGTANTGGIVMRDNIYTIDHTTYSYFEDLPNIFIYLQNSTDAKRKVDKTDIDALRVLPFKNMPKQYGNKNTYYNTEFFLCINYDSVFYNNKLLTAIPDSTASRKWYDAMGNEVT